MSPTNVNYKFGSLVKVTNRDVTSTFIAFTMLVVRQQKNIVVYNYDDFKELCRLKSNKIIIIIIYTYYTKWFMRF